MYHMFMQQHLKVETDMENTGYWHFATQFVRWVQRVLQVETFARTCTHKPC